MDVRFVIVSPASRKAAHAVRLPVLLGRSDEAKFRVQQDSVSRRHCEFFLKDDLVWVRDLGSTNGTFVNGERIKASRATAVPPATQIRVGGIVFRIDYASAAAVPPAAAPGDDTVPLTDTHEPEETSEPTSESAPDVEPTAFDVAAGAIAADAADADPATESAGLNFLGGGAAEPQAGGDDKLDDFFKSLK